jgi:hypothetical protein
MLKDFKLSMLSLRFGFSFDDRTDNRSLSLLASISIIQFKKRSQRIPPRRLERKENAVREHINYVLSTTTYPLTTENLDLIFRI